MRIIMVEKSGLAEDFAAWNVAPNYAAAFLNKCQEVGGMIGLSPFMFNDTIQLDQPYQWFAANCAFWCRAYREAETSKGQCEALASIRATYYMANFLGQSTIAVLIHRWWSSAEELHGLPALNVFPVSKQNPIH